MFAPEFWPRLQRATAELSWLLSRGYATPSAVKLVGDRHDLNQRQRVAVMRCACSDAARSDRQSRQLPVEAIAGKPLLIDGYNVLTSIEAALGGGVILLARDGCFRDMASMHGTYRKVDETMPAIQLLGELLATLRPSLCHWYFDSPVGNSGRLRGTMLEIAQNEQWNWKVDLASNPDGILSEATEAVATADSVVLDRCQRWFNLARFAIEQEIPSASIVPMSDAAQK
jgi:hypothetical protein